jgi:hypothetical protein
MPRDGTLKHLANLAPGFELWKTGWSEPFTSYPDDGYYDEFLNIAAPYFCSAKQCLLVGNWEMDSCLNSRCA